MQEMVFLGSKFQTFSRGGGGGMPLRGIGMSHGQGIRLDPHLASILETYQRNKGIPSDDVIEETSKITLLKKLWFAHLHEVSENQKAGARKAADTRRKKAVNMGPVEDENDGEVCEECDGRDPPD